MVCVMTVLQRPESAPTDDGSDSRSESNLSAARRAAAQSLARWGALVTAAVAGALAVVLSWMVICVPALLAWFADDRSTVTVWQTLGIGANLWALAHRGAVVVGDTSLVLAPLLLTAVPLLACRYAVNQVVVDRPEVRGDAPVIRGWRSAWRALGAAEMSFFAGGYLLTGLLLAELSGLGQASVDVASLVPGLLIVPTVAVALALRREHARQEQPTIDRALRWIELHTPVLVRRGLRPAAEALAGLLVAGLLVVVALVVMRAERMLTLYSLLDTGTVGLVVITAAQLLMLPNLVLWAVGWTTGADVAIGTVHVGWAQTTAGDLPLVPVLAALPEPGPLPSGLWLAVVVPVLAGAWIGYRAIGSASRLSSWWAKAQIAGSGALGVSLVMLVLSWLAVGGLTPGLLGQVGTAPLYVAGALLAELLVGALVTVTALHLRRRRLAAAR